ncbi:MAG: TetR/AcrR family transcriptional regulator [Gammaproteobacteria bacterium]|nr:TetR/AcrR family transcriptional regulator [Gammaproteobacteria bacterium]
MKKRGPEKYEDLLDVATDLFLAAGYRQVSIAKLLEKAGGSRETVYRHFKNKEDLFAAVIDRQIKEYLDSMTAIEVDDEDLRQGLLDLSEATVRVVTSERYVQLRRVVIGESSTRPEIGELYFERTFRAASKGWDSFLSRQQELGHLKDIPPATLAEYIVGMLLYRLSLQRLLNVKKAPTPKQIRTLCTRVVDDFLAGFATAPGPAA